MSTVVLTATARLAQIERCAPGAGATFEAWDTPAAFTPEGWLEYLAEEAMLVGAIAPQVVLDRCAARLLWEQVIAEAMEKGDGALFDIAAMSETAEAAEALVMKWGVQVTADAGSREGRMFARWRAAWREQMRSHGWCTTLDLHDAVVTAIEAGRIALPSAVTLAGFDRLTPFLLRLESALLQNGVLVQHAAEPAPANVDVATHGFAELAHECRAVAHWAADQLARNPDMRIGIVAPDLQRMHRPLARALEAALHPELARPAAAEKPRRYNFSLGHGLSEVALVATALSLLDLAAYGRQIRMTAVSALLNDPYWSDAPAEANARAMLDLQLRAKLGFFTTLDAVLSQLQALQHKPALQCPQLARHLATHARQSRQAADLQQLPSQWAATFRTWLVAAGWAGAGRTLSSHEYQAREAWNMTLASLGSLDAVLGATGVAEAIRRLRVLCAERVFQPQTRGAPPVQVLGMQESAGLRFDALWIMGMNDDAWPPSASPNPLLSLTLQRALGAPRASAAIELAQARDLTARLQQQAPLVRFSFIHCEGARELQPSSLIAHLPGVAFASPVAPAHAVAELEELDDSVGPPIGPGEQARGGTSALQAQAKCPAWAFYRYRLGAKAIEPLREGLDHAGRGTLVHDALQAFWERHHDWATLTAMSDAVRAREIMAAVVHAMAGYETRVTPLQQQFRQLEQERLCRLLDQWLKVEAARAPFSVVACERQVNFAFDGIDVSMRIDRIDEQEGDLIVIDYKTGKAINFSNWASARITEPQLPLYALILSDGQRPGPVAAIAFGMVLGEAPGFVGISARKGLIDNVNDLRHRADSPFVGFDGWSALLEHWQTALSAIAAEFKEGHAAVTFDKAALLEYCDVKPLLRLAERAEQRERVEQDAALAAAAHPTVTV